MWYCLSIQSSNSPYIFIHTWFWLLPLPLPLFCLRLLNISTVLYYFHFFQLDIMVEYLYLFSYIALRKCIKFFCGKVFFLVILDIVVLYRVLVLGKDTERS